MIWFLIIASVWFLFWLIGKLVGSRPPEPWKIQLEPGLAELRADDPTWKERVLEYCESPAESAFLKAMIAGYDLRPHLAWLNGGGLSLTLQVKMPPYRVDFLANNWLVIEIDGAAYHSSPEAVSDDRKRDDYLRTKGYSTVRIPAKLVFDDAPEAVRRVRTAIAEGPPEDVRRVREAMSEDRSPEAAVAPSEPRSALGAGLAGIKQAAQSVDRFMSELDRSIERGEAFKQALTAPRSTFDAEKNVITKAFEIAEQTIRVEEHRAKSEAHAQSFDRTYKELEAAIERRRRERGLPSGPRTITIAPFTAPPVHPDAEINESIQRQYRSLREDRAVFFEEARCRLQENSRLRDPVKDFLERMGCRACWDAIAQPSPSGRRAQL